MTSMTTPPYADVFSAGLVHRFLEESARRLPDKIAVIQDEVRISYSWLNDRANRLARWMTAQGVSRGDRVAILFENGPEYIVAYYASLKAGAVAVPLSSDLKPHGLEPILAELEPRVLLCSRRFERMLIATASGISPSILLIVRNPRLSLPKGLSVIEWKDVLQQGSTGNPNLPISSSDLASIIYTSGSTGTPKGVMLSHGNITANAKSICSYLSIRETDVQMVVLPFFYVMGKSLLNTHIAAGATLVINNKFAFPADVIHQMETEKVTAFSGVPSTYAYLLYRSPLAAHRDRLTHLRYCSQAGGHMSMKLKQELRRVLPNHTKIFIMYGATEASARLTYLDPDRFHEKIDSIGKPIPGVAIRILSKDGYEVPTGQTGELVASGPNIMKGYWRDEKSTAEVLDENGYHTGDFGHMDKDGYLFVWGRKDNLLKVGGHRVNPQEIEDVLSESGLIVEAVVLGMEDALLGNRLVALLSPTDPDIEKTKIFQYCSMHLDKSKVPSEIIFFKTIPKKMTGKIDRDKCINILKTNQ